MTFDPRAENLRKWQWPGKLRRAICGEIKPVPPQEYDPEIMDSA